MRAALIPIAGQPRRAGHAAPASLAGKTLARRQLDFALAAGCERVIAYGDGGAPETIALRHEAEAAGARFQAIRECHGLLGIVRSADELLVLAPGLIAEEPLALEALAKGPAVLVFPAGPGVAAGFERIDLERAWAGALVVPGGLVERLGDLPSESEPAAALLRIALQSRVPERKMPEQLLAGGAWAIVGANDNAALREKDWLGRNLPAASASGATHRAARLALRGFGTRLLAIPRAIPAMLAGVAALLAGGVTAAVYELPALGFALVAIGAVLAELSFGLRQLRDAPFGPRRPARLPLAVPWAVDAALTAAVVLAIEGAWAHRLFPALVLFAALHASRAVSWAMPAALLGDRAVLAAAFAVAAAFGLAEPAAMAAGLAILLLEAAKSRAKRG